jgi:hypothetical protein
MMDRKQTVMKEGVRDKKLPLQSTSSDFLLPGFIT